MEKKHTMFELFQMVLPYESRTQQEKSEEYIC